MVMAGRKAARRRGACVMAQGQTGGGNPAKQPGDLTQVVRPLLQGLPHAEAAAATQTATGHALCEICVCLGVLSQAKHIN